MEKGLEKVFIFLKEVLEGGKNFGKILEIDEKSFKCFDEKKCKKVGAVDGSSYEILDGEFFIIGGRRTGYVISDSEKILERNIGEIEVDFLTKENMDIDNLHEVNEILRQMEEYLLVREVIKKLDKDDIILLDGSFEGNEFVSDILKKNFEMSRERGIHMVGISKKSGMLIKNFPMINMIKKKGDKIFPKKRWYYPLSGETYVVKFHPLSRFAFRVDVDQKEDVEKIFAEIASLCNDVCFLGYPYPLADVHNSVVIKSHDAFEIRMKLQEMAIKNGFTMEDWEELFFDYHEYLG